MGKLTILPQRILSPYAYSTLIPLIGGVEDLDIVTTLETQTLTNKTFGTIRSVLSIDNIANISYFIAAALSVADSATETGVARFQIQPSATSAVSGTKPQSAVDADLMILATNTQNWGAGVLTALNAYVGVKTGATGIFTDLTAFKTSGAIQAGTATNTYAVRIKDITGSGTVTNQYGLYVDNLTKGGTTNYAIYLAGSNAPIELGDALVYSLKLGEAMNLNGQVFSAGGGNAQINTTGQDAGLIIQSTQDTTSGARLVLRHIDASPDATDIVGSVRFEGRDDTPSTQSYGQIQVEIDDPANASKDSHFEWYLRVANAWNEAMTLSGAGLVWADVGFNADEYYQVAGVQVVGGRLVDARCDDAINSGDATTDGVIDALRDAMITHGLIAAA